MYLIVENINVKEQGVLKRIDDNTLFCNIFEKVMAHRCKNERPTSGRSINDWA